MEKPRIILPSVKWLTGNDIETSINVFTGSYGTDPYSGLTARTTMAYKTRFVMPEKPGEGEPPLEHPEIPKGFEASYRLIYPFGHTPRESEEIMMFFDYEPTGEEPRVISPKAAESAQKWLNEQLEALIANGTITAADDIV